MSEISVIIPVYNVEKYLKECLNSISNQSFRDLEIICVNDGSTDNSLDILKNHAENDDRVTIITQENQGLGAARNRGFHHATGNYVYFIDSDDYLELDALEKLHENAISNQSQMVLFMYQTVDENGIVKKRNSGFNIYKIFGDIDYNNFSFTYDDVRKYIMNSSFSACLKLYKKDFVDNIDFSFPAGVSFEDIPVHVRVMLEAKSMSFVPESLYNYRTNPDSIINSNANCFDIFTNIDLVEEYLIESDHYDELENEFIFFKIVQISQYLEDNASEEYFSKAKEEFEKITIKDEKTIYKRFLKEYRLVLGSSGLDDYYSKKNKKKTKSKSAKSRSFKIRFLDLIGKN